MTALSESLPARRARSQGRSAIALLLSVGLHGIALAGFLAWDEPESEETVIVISLVSEWAAEASVASEVPVDTASAAEAPAPPAPIALPLDAPRLEPEQEEIEEVAPEPEPVSEPEPPPAIVTSPLDLDAAMPALPIAPPAELTPVEPAPVEIAQVDPAPPPKRPPPRRHIERPARVDAEAILPTPPAARTAPAEDSVAAELDKGASPVTPATPATASEPSPDRSAETLSERLPESYRQALLKWLERRKFYPPAARRARLEGRIVLRIRLDRDGTVLGASVANGSGHVILDEAALDLVRRAGTAPPLPAAFPADQAEIVAPLSFFLK